MAIRWAVVALCWYVLSEESSARAGGENLRLPVTRDLWVSAVGSEVNGNNGGAHRLKVKSIQELTLLDIDPTPLKGRVVKKATLFLKLAGEERLGRITVGTVSAEWVEGTGSGYEVQPGSSTFNRRVHPHGHWSYPGSDLTSVILGQGGSFWRMADARAPDAEGWQAIPVDPSIVAARVAGVSHGFVVFDDTGSEWTRDGEKWSLRLFPNRFLHSRESGEMNAPYFEIELGAADSDAPLAPRALHQMNLIGHGFDMLPEGEVTLGWKTPGDKGEAGTIGFFVTLNGHQAPRYLIPSVDAWTQRRSINQRAPRRDDLLNEIDRDAREMVMHIRDLPLVPGATVRVGVRAVDAAGNIGPEGLCDVMLEEASKPFSGKSPEPFSETAPLPKLGGVEVAIVDELDKIDPRSGVIIPSQPSSYWSANHLWTAKRPLIGLYGGRHEFVSFQVALRGRERGVRASVKFDGDAASGPQVEIGRYVPVTTSIGPIGDPIIPLRDGAIDVDGNASLHVEMFIPKIVPPGTLHGVLSMTAGSERLEIPLELKVWDVTFPGLLSFLPEMNCYDLPANELDYYRLAREHQTVLNRVPYYQNGRIADGCAPNWDGTKLDFTDWDRRFGPLFDGSAFAGTKRGAHWVECFYLPLHENWPTPIEGNYNGDYWADRAFPPSYRSAFVEVTRQFTAHLQEREWSHTFFQFYLNNKNDFKRNGWSRGSSPWLLDEPANFQDYWALRWFGLAFHEGVAAFAETSPHWPSMFFRADISRPQWQREVLDDLMDYAVVGSAFRPYNRVVMDRKARDVQRVLEYGSTNSLEQSNMQPVGWCVDAWTLGADGVVPWQTVGTAKSWEEADPLALFYPGRVEGEKPAPSVRLKAYRRGEQLVEYLSAYLLYGRLPRWALARDVRSNLKLSGERRGAGEDAGRVEYDGLRPQQEWAMRVRLGELLSEAHANRDSVSQAVPPVRGRARFDSYYVTGFDPMAARATK